MNRVFMAAPLGALILLAGCGGGSAPAPSNAAAPANATVPAAPVTPAPADTPAPEPSPSAAPAVAADAGAKPSFDCASPDLGTAEHIICNRPELAEDDREIAAVYKRLRSQLLAHGKDALMEEQQEYLNRRSECTTERCVFMAQKERLDELRQAENP
ncbi:lysozyme inhibitor LprI family protein [Sphingomonas canadensis]|uniref:Lysozyme inhibitor LprI family protein n=1 Tax=Sphingomonas canadensis TaxID=1219257 RepID=A0ABW3H8D4_9SPHN|nr:hypothetical protein [Sphingomonas canadensis]MCW3837483.1 hypothetical protein [Sphingomonas canadensis]